MVTQNQSNNSSFVDEMEDGCNDILEDTVSGLTTSEWQQKGTMASYGSFCRR